jgi:hypothetical protein
LNESQLSQNNEYDRKRRELESEIEKFRTEKRQFQNEQFDVKNSQKRETAGIEEERKRSETRLRESRERSRQDNIFFLIIGLLVGVIAGYLFKQAGNFI